MLRAGPFSDERVLRLANRRFVPFYFDLNDRGAAGDPDARAFVVKVKRELGGSRVPTPPVLFMTAEGEVLAEVSNYADANTVLRTMEQVLRENPQYAQPSKEEQRLEGIEKAVLLIDLRQLEEAGQFLATLKSQEARYLQGRLAREGRDWKEMERQFSKVTKQDLRDDIEMESTYQAWFDRDFKTLEKATAGISKESNRYSEARYYHGLALYHSGEKEKAREVWAETVQGCPQDPWIYRCDWAHSQSKASGRGGRVFSSGGSKTLLGRIGYMGSSNPDLEGPR